MSYIVFGAGGHAKVIVDILRSNGEEIIGVLDDHCKEETWNGFPVLGGRNQIDQLVSLYPEALLIVAIGDNTTRLKMASQFKVAGAKFGTAIHPSAVVSPSSFIGEGSVIMPNSVINADAYVGEHVIVNTAATVDHDCRIEDFAHISPGVHMAGGVQIGCCAHIGIGASLIPGVRVGCNTIVGAASCVIRDLPEKVTAVGCPAKVIKTDNDKG
ncbi:acetyltransferase [Paenibacillus sp. P2(2022)]|uniref:acetyltransferase n=1 Tax=Paenibacillus TaxID=44249 RepID=UPI0005ECDFBF|nr:MULTISPECIES: acetyltransferase [Paenibacillus]AUS28878.1 acetyltransferase [Paenibacillus polymyxa]KAE8559456.1 acetyltransferase [Paenibacillus polymyxa]KJK29942.1 acetyltransferase [Paenibacillus polymyxa]MCJ1221719.1 acetyltransferase [Paenibacillus polymyxa]MDG0054434.1 acetyltransferase [Paenibacillus sp. P2(2022)]